MVDHSELRRLAEACANAERCQREALKADGMDYIPPKVFEDTAAAQHALRAAANPARIIALLDEVEALKRERDDAVREIEVIRLLRKVDEIPFGSGGNTHD